MKAVRIHEDGGPEVLRYEDVDDPTAGPGEVLVSLRAAGLNHLDAKAGCARCQACSGLSAWERVAARERDDVLVAGH